MKTTLIIATLAAMATAASIPQAGWSGNKDERSSALAHRAPRQAETESAASSNALNLDDVDFEYFLRRDGGLASEEAEVNRASRAADGAARVGGDVIKSGADAWPFGVGDDGNVEGDGNVGGSEENQGGEEQPPATGSKALGRS